MIAEGDPIWIGVAAVIGAIGSATATVITALNARTGKRIEAKLNTANGEPNGNHEKEVT